MASRSFKPASYLASAAQQAPNRSPRPSFTRSSSNSSTVSTKSEDSNIVAGIRGLSMVDGKENGKGRSEHMGPPRSITPVNGSSSVSHIPLLDTPGRKRSQPIAIELPSRGTAAYTPLSARGDLPGGYFPNHEEITISYRSHPFSNYHGRSHQNESAMTMSPTFSPTSDTTPKMSTHMLSSSAFGQLSPTIPDTLRIPMGKYHPSNYKSPASTEVSTPTTNPRAPLPPTNLSIPATTNKRSSKERPGHERRSSDIKRKLQQYQRDMIAQARAAAPTTNDGRTSKEPNSPRLQPLGSPGPITPFELEEADGYIVAGSSAVRKENERQLEMMLNKPYTGAKPSPAERRV
ncbi:hypothetical protein ONS95_004418 [Cadophora gregata]|uniref:uncharacterized protein n=1 Tax=Cadophora gregata TaxID=51156 RepID=UPI0026DBC000|nr:uncharacterized protein ONS95_004418 [Cadophora gregata]KAK0105186.1 hypothetical protein ONS96_004587 [Cadophora gregata f. sp. sojae]KAK0105905.1 hypothetical protein ONS95_004418 [Cadophora gregata]